MDKLYPLLLTLALSFTFTVQGRELLQDETNTIHVFNTSVKSVVNVTGKQVVRTGVGWFHFDTREIPVGAGSGFVWDKSGHVVTNFHVVARGGSFVVSFHKDKKQYEAKVVGAEPKKDIAVLKLVEKPSQLHPIDKGISHSLKVGQKALAIGNPFGLDHTITQGIISALDRKIQGIGGVEIHQMIQTDCSINPGNSGGPLLNSSGELIGMNTAIYSRSGSSAGVGFAVPVDTIKRLVPQLIQYGEVQRPGLGILLFPDSSEQHIKSVYGIERGLIIKSVLAGGAAEKGGLKGMSRDRRNYVLGDVILEVDRKKVNSYNDIYHALDNKKIGDRVRIKYRRGNRTKTLSLKLGKSISP